MFFTYLITLIVIYVIYYLLMVSLDLKKIKKTARVDNEGDDVDISSAVGNYVPIDTSEIIDDGKDNQIAAENNEKEPMVIPIQPEATVTDEEFDDSQKVYPGFEDNDDNSHFGDAMTDNGNFESEESNDDFLNQYARTEEQVQAEQAAVLLDDDAIPFSGSDEEKADDEPIDIGDEDVAVHGGYYAFDLNQMFKEEYERVGEEFVGMKVTSK